MDREKIISEIKAAITEEFNNNPLLNYTIKEYIAEKHNGEVLVAYDEFVGFIDDETVALFIAEGIDVKEDVIHCATNALVNEKTVKELLDDIVDTSFGELIKRMIDRGVIIMQY